MDTIFYALKIIGSLALFLFGMKTMSDGIQKAAGERLHNIINFMTGNRFSATFTGFSITALIQSSSATTVMVVSFVSAGLLTLTQSIGVIMGANIGTTVTGWIIAIFGFKMNISEIALPIIGVGLPLLFYKKLGKKDWGEAIIGFGLLFIGLQFLKETVQELNLGPETFSFITQYSNLGYFYILICVAIGTLITIMVQSSSAAMAVTLTMAATGLIDFPTAAAIILGENIGTTITAQLAAIGTNISARRAAWVHTLFNVMGVIWISVFFMPFLKLVDSIIPGAVFNVATGDLSKEIISPHLAAFHTLFNIANTLIFIWFTPLLAKLVIKFVRPKKEDESDVYHLKYISTAIQDTPEINILNAKKELSRMAEITNQMYTKFLNIFHNPDKKMGGEVAELIKQEEYTDQMQVEISHFLVDCAKENLNEMSANNVNAMIRIVNELESIGDSCVNLIILTRRRYDNKIVFHSNVMKELEPYTKLVKDFIEFNGNRFLKHLSSEEIKKAYELERLIDTYRDDLKSASQERLQKGANVVSEILYMDILRHIERIGDYCLNISQALRLIR